MITTLLPILAITSPTMPQVRAQQKPPLRQKQADPVQADRRRKHQLLPWSAAQATIMPSVGPGEGFIIWHNGNTVYLIGNNDTKRGIKYAGSIHVRGGRITGASDWFNERPDNFTVRGHDTINFRFDVHQVADGLKFEVTGGAQIVFNLKIAGKRAASVIYGSKLTPATHRPVAFDMTK